MIAGLSPADWPFTAGDENYRKVAPTMRQFIEDLEGAWGSAADVTSRCITDIELKTYPRTVTLDVPDDAVVVEKKRGGVDWRDRDALVLLPNPVFECRATTLVQRVRRPIHHERSSEHICVSRSYRGRRRATQGGLPHGGVVVPRIWFRHAGRATSRLRLFGPNLGEDPPNSTFVVAQILRLSGVPQRLR